MDRNEALIMEERRQSQLFLNAIQDAAKTVIPTLETPMIDALARAVATFSGALLTSIPAGKHRKQVADMMTRVAANSLQANDGKTKQATIISAGSLQ